MFSILPAHSVLRPFVPIKGGFCPPILLSHANKGGNSNPPLIGTNDLKPYFARGTQNSEKKSVPPSLNSAPPNQNTKPLAIYELINQYVAGYASIYMPQMGDWLFHYTLHPKELPVTYPYLVPKEFWHNLMPPFETVSFQSAVDEVNQVAAIRLRGYWISAECNSSKVAILAHGFHMDASCMIPLANIFHDQGYHVFMPEFRAHGESQNEASTIGFHEGKDLLGAIRFLKSAYPEQSKAITLLGHSMGASTILMLPKSLEHIPGAMQEIKETVSHIVLDAPYERLDLKNNPFITSTVYKTGENKPLRKALVDYFVQRMNSLETTHTLKLPCHFDALSPPSYFKSSDLSQKPILLLHGKNDERTPYIQAERIQEQFKTLPDFTFKTLDADHLNYQWRLAGFPQNMYYRRSVLRDDTNYLAALKAHFKW